MHAYQYSTICDIHASSANLNGKCSSDCNNQFFCAIPIDLDNKKWNDINMIDKGSGNNVIFLDASHLHHGYLLELASVSVKVWLRTASTATTPGLAAERGWPTYWILVDMYLPAIGSHGILQVVLEVIRVLQSHNR